MIRCSMNIRENCPRKCFWTKEKETRAKFNPGLSANRPSNNWALHNIKPPLGNSLVPVEAENKKVPLPPSPLQPWTKTLFLAIISKLLHHHGDFNKKPKWAYREMYAKKDFFFSRRIKHIWHAIVTTYTFIKSFFLTAKNKLKKAHLCFTSLRNCSKMHFISCQSEFGVWKFNVYLNFNYWQFIAFFPGIILKKKVSRKILHSSVTTSDNGTTYMSYLVSITFKTLFHYT